MSWFMVGSAAVTVISSAAQGSAEASSTNANSVEQNEAIIKANIANTIRTGYRIGLANMQQGLKKQQAVQQGYDITKAGGEALGQANANAAASGSVGASVTAVAEDIKMKMGEAKATAQNQSDIDRANFQTQIENITFEGQNSTLEGVESSAQSSGDIWGGAFMSGAMSFASSYMGSKMKLGVGTPTTGTYNNGSFGGSGFDTKSWGVQR